jgi:hypothetical protein
MDDIKKFDIQTNSKLDQYEDLLKKFHQWTSIKREIKITSLLEGNRIQFDIEDIFATGSIWGVLTSNPCAVVNIKDCAFSIKCMTFILNGDSIEKMTVGIKTISTEKGEILKNLIKEDIKIELREFILNDKIHYFYIELPKLAS